MMMMLTFLLLAISLQILSGFVREIAIRRKVYSCGFHERPNLYRAVADGDDANAESSKSGYFRLPKDNEVFPLDNYFLEPGNEEMDETSDSPLDGETRNSIVRQLEMAFDNYQPWEIIEMSEKLFVMPEQLEKVRELVRRLDSLEEYAAKQGGWDENLVDAMRSSRSEVRMWAKDTEFYDTNGNRKEQVTLWPWNRRS